MKTCAGFTLIELMTTLVVAMVLISIAMPSLASLYHAYRADSAIRTIQSTLQLARNSAISYGSRVTACPLQEGDCTQDWTLGITIFIDRGDSNTIDGSDKILLTTDNFHQSDFVTYNRTAVRFQPDGLASGTNGTLRYCPNSVSSKHSKAVIINQAGRIRFSKDSNIRCD